MKSQPRIFLAMSLLILLSMTGCKRGWDRIPGGTTHLATQRIDVPAETASSTPPPTPIVEGSQPTQAEAPAPSVPPTQAILVETAIPAGIAMEDISPAADDLSDLIDSFTNDLQSVDTLDDVK